MTKFSCAGDIRNIASTTGYLSGTTGAQHLSTGGTRTSKYPLYVGKTLRNCGLIFSLKGHSVEDLSHHIFLAIQVLGIPGFHRLHDHIIAGHPSPLSAWPAVRVGQL